MRVLIVAPDQPGINTIPEVRLIQAWHHTSTLNGRVTSEDIFRACQDTAFDVIHFATHGGPDGVLLSDGEVFSAEDVAQVARLRETGEVFFNACETGSIAAYVVSHGVRTAISAEREVEETQAWKLPAAYYSARRNGHSKDPVGAYVMASSGDGDYSLMVDPRWIIELQKATVAAMSATPHGALMLSKSEAIKWALFILVASIALSTLLARIGG